MLTNSIIFSTYRPSVIPANLPNKDINIFDHTVEPTPKLNISFKKSSTNQNCLAVSATHIFAAQADKAVVQVYNREKGTKESDVPFGERIASCCFIESKDRDGVGILVLGIEGGRLILWEICTGRQVSTPPAHLEAVTCLAVDSTRNFLLSGSKDHNVHIWKLANLLSFTTESRTPHKTFSDHRGVITSLSISHSQLSDSFAISTSEDNTVLIWNFRTASRLATILVTSIPQSLALDPADRAFYIGFEDSLQFVDLNSVSFKSPNEAIDLGESNKWINEPPLVCLAVNSDGTHILTGHQNGKVLKRTTPKGQPTLVYDSHMPVSNIVALDPTGFPYQRQPTTIPSIVKPKLDMVVKDGSLLPDRYEFHAKFTSFSSQGQGMDNLLSDFDELLEHASFPDDLLSAPLTSGIKTKGLEFDETAMDKLTELKQESELASTKLENLTNELKRLQQLELARQRSKKLNRIRRSKAMEVMRKKAMGEKNGIDVEEVDQQMEDVSSDTDA